MEAGIQGITLEHLKGMRQQFNCYYSGIFKAMYGLEKMSPKLVKLLIWSVEKEQYLPSKSKLMEYQLQFDKEDQIIKDINELAKTKK